MAKKIKKAAHNLGAIHPQHLAIPAFTSPPYRWVLAVVLGIETLLLIWALAHQFIPSEAWRNIAFYSNLVLCTLCLVYLAYAFRLNPNPYTSKFKLAFLVIFLPVLVYCWGYLALTFGAGDLLTQLIGKPAVIQDILTKHADDDERFKKEYVAKGEYEKRYFDNRKGCITRLTSDLIKQGMPVHVCVSGQDFAKSPKHVAVKIHGKQSYAGFAIQTVEYDWLKTAFLPKED